MRLRLPLLMITILTGASAHAASHTVLVDDSFFSPASLTIDVGDTVTWTNVGNMAHNVRADDGSFRCSEGCGAIDGSPSASPWSVTITFDEPGEVGYYCEAHGAPGIGMAGTIIVEGDPPPPPPGDANIVNVPIAGSVQGNNAFFRTSLRLFNPSETETISVGGAFLPVGQNNAAAPEVVVTVAPRSVSIFDDVVGTLFNASGLGALRFHSDDPFSVTSRIFTDSNCGDPEGGTFGQFVTGAAEGAALLEGAVLNLEVSEAFRSNVGVHNTSLEPSTVTLTLHDSSGVLAGPVEQVFGPREPLGPTALVTLFGLSSIDDENLWVEFSATRPVHVYGSVVDGITQDQIFIHAVPLGE